MNPCTCGAGLIRGPHHSVTCGMREPFVNPHDAYQYRTGGRRSGKSTPPPWTGETPPMPAREVGDFYRHAEGYDVLVWSTSTPLTAFPVRAAAEPRGEMLVTSEWLSRAPQADLTRFERMGGAYMAAGGRLTRRDDFACDGFWLGWRRDPVTVTRVLHERFAPDGTLHPVDPSRDAGVAIYNPTR